MLLCFLVALALPRIVEAASSLVARRALPLLAGPAAAWVADYAEHQWGAVVIIGILSVPAASLLLDQLVETPATRRAIIVSEAIAAAGVSAFLGYAVLGLMGIAELLVIALCVILAVLAAATSLNFRRGFADAT